MKEGYGLSIRTDRTDGIGRFRSVNDQKIHAYLARLLWQHPWIDILFRFKRLNCYYMNIFLLPKASKRELAVQK